MLPWYLARNNPSINCMIVRVAFWKSWTTQCTRKYTKNF